MHRGIQSPNRSRRAACVSRHSDVEQIQNFVCSSGTEPPFTEDADLIVTRRPIASCHYPASVLANHERVFLGVHISPRRKGIQTQEPDCSANSAESALGAASPLFAAWQ